MTRFTLHVAAPPRAVFDYLGDPRRRAEWQASLRGVDLVDDPPVWEGTRWVDRTMLGARPRLRITEMRPPSGPDAGVWTEVGHWRGLRADLTLRFEQEQDGTRLTATVEIDGWQPARAVLRVLAAPAVRSDLRRAARILER